MTHRMRKTWKSSAKSRRLNFEALEARLCLSTYTTVDLMPLPGQDSSRAFALNDNGLVVGSSSYGAVVWSVNQAGSGDAVEPVELPALIPTVRSSLAYDVNNQGMIAGASHYSESDPVSDHAVVWTGSDSSYEVLDLGVLPGRFEGSIAYSISEPDGSGFVWVAGESGYYDPATQASVSHAVLWKVDPDRDQPSFVLMLDLAPSESFVHANDVKVIDDSVLVAGRIGPQAVIWTVSLGGVVSAPVPIAGTGDIEPLEANALNNDGDVVGQAWVGSVQNGFLYDGAEMTDLGSLANFGSYASGINDNDVVVGTCTNHVQGPNFDYYAFVWEDGIMYDLFHQVSDRTFSRLDRACDVNDNGDIVGNGAMKDRNNWKFHGFLARPDSGQHDEQPDTYSSTNVPKTIPDPHPKKGPVAVPSQLSISGTGDTVDKLDVDVMIVHASMGDLTVTLASPQQPLVQLPLEFVNGEWSLASPEAFQNQSLDGTWVLTVTDTVKNGVTGTLQAWSLNVTPLVGAAAAGEASLMSAALLPVALVQPRVAEADAPYNQADTAVEAEDNLFRAAGTTMYVSAAETILSLPGIHAAATDAAIVELDLRPLNEQLEVDLAIALSQSWARVSLTDCQSGCWTCWFT